MIPCVPFIGYALPGPELVIRQLLCVINTLLANDPKSEMKAVHYLCQSQQHTTTSHEYDFDTSCQVFPSNISIGDQHNSCQANRVWCSRQCTYPCLFNAEDHQVYTAMAKTMKGECSLSYSIQVQIMSLTSTVCVAAACLILDLFKGDMCLAKVTIVWSSGDWLEGLVAVSLHRLCISDQRATGLTKEVSAAALEKLKAEQVEVHAWEMVQCCSKWEKPSSTEG
jgi:hypothetical protein